MGLSESSRGDGNPSTLVILAGVVLLALLIVWATQMPRVTFVDPPLPSPSVSSTK
jgi:hypothetical protein